MHVTSISQTPIINEVNSFTDLIILTSVKLKIIVYNFASKLTGLDLTALDSVINASTELVTVITTPIVEMLFFEVIK